MIRRNFIKQNKALFKGWKEGPVSNIYLHSQFTRAMSVITETLESEHLNLNLYSAILNLSAKPHWVGVFSYKKLEITLCQMIVVESN